MHVKHTAHKNTGVSKDAGQSIWCESLTKGHLEKNRTRAFERDLQALTHECNMFAEHRNFKKDDTPRNLVLALLCETGELAELLQWKKDNLKAIPTKLADKTAQEVADVTVYFLRLADVVKSLE